MEAVVADADIWSPSVPWSIGPGQAVWAAAQGLLAAAGTRSCSGTGCGAHDLAGNPAGLESVVNELCHVVEALEPYDALHPETIALDEELSRRRRRRSRTG